MGIRLDWSSLRVVANVHHKLLTLKSLLTTYLLRCFQGRARHSVRCYGVKQGVSHSFVSEPKPSDIYSHNHFK